MQVLSQSAFLQALGYAIASSLWQSALLWLLVAGCNSLLKLTSNVKYKVALVAQFGAFVWFIVTLQFYYTKCSEAIAQMKFSGLNSGNAFILQSGSNSFSSVILSAILKGEKLLPYLSIAYLCLLVILAIRWIKGYRQTNLIKTQGLQKIDVQWRLFVKRVSELLNIKHGVHIYVSDLVKSPLTIGFLKPLILIPVASINNLTTYQLEAVILHELAHIKRADYIINIVQSIIEITLFFNPFTQLLGKIIKRERENSCDDWVLQFQYDPSTYAEALLRIAYMQQAPAFAMNAGGKEKDLLWRVKRMLNQKEKTFQYRNRLFALLLITGLLSSVTWFNPAVRSTTTSQQSKPSQPVMEEPLASKVDNPLFNPVFFLNKPYKEEIRKAVADASLELRNSKEYSLNLMQTTNNVLENVAPAVADKIKTFNIDLPSVMTQAGNVVNLTLRNMDASGELPQELKGLKDSTAVFNLLNTATAALKNIDWKKMGKEVDNVQGELKKELEDKALFAGVDVKVGDIIRKSLLTAQRSLAQLRVSSEDNYDDEDEAPAVLSSGGAILQAPAAKKNQHVQKLKIKYFEAKKAVDSLVRVFGLNRLPNRVLPDLERGNLYTVAANQYVYTTPPQSVDYSYNVKPVVNTFIPAKYEEGKPIALGKGNEVSVSTGTSTLIAVKEDAGNTDSYKKRITIETLDTAGQRHTFHITVEVYQ